MEKIPRYLALTLLIWLSLQGLYFTLVIWQYILFENTHEFWEAYGFWLGSLVLSILFPFIWEPIFEKLGS